MKRTIVFAAAVLCGSLLLPARAADNFALRSGDRVVFYGDSITDQRLYTTFAETFIVTRFPGREITFIHSGWGGDRVSGGGGGPVDVRLRRDVVAYQPTVVTIMLGMNDGKYRAFDEAIFADYSSGYEKMVASLKAALPGVRLTLIQPSPFDDVTRPPTFPGGYNAVLVRYGAFIRALAEREHQSVADLNTSVVAALAKADASDHENALKIIPDRVHPGNGGHLLMAAALVKAWGAPALVSSISLDAAAASVIASEGARAAEVESVSGGGLKWTQTDEALPMPVNMKDVPTALAVRSSDFVDSLNRQMLKVSGLKGSAYSLKIDGQPAGRFSATDLATGVNLAMMDTPMSRQAAAVHALTLKHNNVHFARWRSIEVPLADDKLDSVGPAMSKLDDLDRELVSQQRAAAQPKPHRFELSPE
jgi:lysophospholipase L1-like esterase